MIARLMGGLTITSLVNAAAALLLLTSPWLAGFTRNAVASGNAVVFGLLMLFFTAAALLQLRDWRSWMNLVPGVWVLLSPSILGFAAHEVPTVIHTVVGLLVSILALIDLCRNETLHLED